MTVAFDAITIIPAEPTEATGNISGTHAPVGTPKGVIVLIHQEELVGSDEVSSIDYGGVPMVEMGLSPVLHTTGEGGATYAYKLTSGIPTGAQTVTATVSGASPKIMAVITLTAGGDTEELDTSIINSDAGGVNPSVTVSLGGRDCFVAEVWYAGFASPASVTPKTNWTNRQDHDYGGTCAGFYTYDIISNADVSAGYTAADDDCVLLAIAVSELQSTSDTIHSGPMLFNGG